MRGLPPLARYGIAVAAAAVATLLRLPLDASWGGKFPLILFYPAVMISAFLGGFGPGMVTTVLCAAAADYLWMSPVHSLAIDAPGDVLGLLLFVVIGGLISGLNEAWRREARRVAESDRQQARLHGAEQAARLEEAVRAREDFVSIASHELRNPVNALQLQLAVILRALERDPASQTPAVLWDRVGRASVQVGRLSRLIDNLLDVSRISAGSFLLEPEDVDWSVATRAALDQLGYELKAGQIALRTPPAPLVGFWDRLRLEQIVTNLVSNAIKYGDGKPIEISLCADDGTARLSVTDHGIGIDTEKRDRLFARFERAVSGPKYRGFGLGLWITRGIVEAMHGQMSVESRPGEGSTFSVVLPLRPPAAT